MAVEDMSAAEWATLPIAIPLAMAVQILDAIRPELSDDVAGRIEAIRERIGGSDDGLNFGDPATLATAPIMIPFGLFMTALLEIAPDIANAILDGIRDAREMIERLTEAGFVMVGLQDKGHA